MITPNLSIKLVIIYYFIFGLLALHFLTGISKLLGIFLIYYAYVNILCLRNKGKKLFKLAVLKINIGLLSLINLILIFNILNSKKQIINKISKEDIKLGIIILLMIPIIAHYISIRNYKF